MAQIDHWESVVPEGAEFSYTLPSTEPAAAWKESGFDDSNWSIGAASIGYGDDDDATVISATASVYLRKVFNIVDLSAIEQVILHMDFDDGFVAYLNGVEIARANMSGNPPAFDQLSDGLHEALLYQGIVPEHFEIDAALLNQGENILAVQVHNQSLNSSDLTAMPVLSLGINNTSNDYFPTPDWFNYRTPVNFESSNLPI
ncbi:MAG: hypothetical protein R3345_08910, partial [Fulvivirga sp.]|nr:hypothetical protein [Fulvivirga sp.]